MGLEKISEQINYEFEADRDHAQLLIEVPDPPKSFEEARKIIEGLGIHITETRYLSSHSILIKLDIIDMRDVTLRLTENGFFNIKGINAAPPL